MEFIAISQLTFVIYVTFNPTCVCVERGDNFKQYFSFCPTLLCIRLVLNDNAIAKLIVKWAITVQVSSASFEFNIP